MVAIVSGNSLGLNLTSLGLLGQHGALGKAAHGTTGEAVYVNAATGNLVLQTEDARLVGRGPDVAALRTYNSQGLLDDDNGDNWSSGSWLQPLQLTGTLNASGSTLRRTDRDGSAAVYSFDAGQGRYRTTDGGGAHDSIAFLAADNQLEWRDGDTGATQRFQAGGALRLLSMCDASGNALTYTYNASGGLETVASASGETTTYVYSGNNLVQVRTQDNAGVVRTQVRYGYDAGNRLAEVVVDLTPADDSTADTRVLRTTYGYDGASKRVASIAQSDGHRITFTYAQDPASGVYRIAAVTNALGEAFTFTYGTASTVVRNARGLATTLEFGVQGWLSRVITPAAGGVAASRSFSYTANGDVASITDGEGRVTVFEYDANGNQVLQRDAAGSTVSRTFDARNQLLNETVYTVADPDGAGAAQPSAPVTTRHVYDAAGRNLVRFVVSGEGRVTEHRYNGFGERVATLVYAGGTFAVAGLATKASASEAELAAWAASQPAAGVQRQDMAYDARGELQSRTRYARLAADGTGVADGTHSRETFVRDQHGRLLQSVSASGGTTLFTYDGLGRLLASTNAVGEATVTAYGETSQRNVVTLASGLVTTTSYDAAGRLLSVAQSGPGTVALGETRYFHDASARLRMTQDPTGVRQWHLYDDAGRKTVDVDGNGSMTEYGYDRNDRLVSSVRYATAVDTALLVDGAGQPVLTATTEAVRPASTTADARTWRVYDVAGQLVRQAQSVGSANAVAITETRYDGAGRVTAVVRYANTVDASVATTALPATSAQDRTTRHFHDADGLLRGTLDPEGYLVTFAYSPAGQLVERHAFAILTDNSLRVAGTLAQLQPAATSADQRTVHLYDAKGQFAGEVDAEAYLTETVRDADGRVTQTIRYANRVTATVTPASTLASIRPAPSAADRVTATAYDALGRVQQETSAEGVVKQFAYDSAGNLVGTVLAAGTTELRSLLARYDVQGRLTAELSAEGAALLTGGQTQAQVDAIWAQHGTAHGYDAAGRRVSSTDALGNRTFFYYDADGALTHTVNALGEVRERRHDTLGRLVDEIAYAGRMATTGLTGGTATSAFTSAVAAIANAAVDSRTSTAYARDGAVAFRTDALGSVTTYSANAFGEETGSVQPVGSGVNLARTYSIDRRGLRSGSAADAAGINAVTSTTHDAFGRVTRTVDANGNVRQQSHDRLGRVVTTTDPLNALRTTSYDAFGRVLTQTDALGHATHYAYDAAARTVSVTTPEGIRTTTAYTRHGQVLSVTDGKGQVMSYTYDRDGHLRTTASTLTTASNTYDAAGRLTWSTGANGHEVTYGYDAAGRVLTRRVDPAGLDLTTSYAYDGKGQQVSVTDPNGTVTTIAYDRLGQVLRKTVDPGGLNLQVVYTYDARGGVLTMTSPGGTVTQYAYDALGRRTQERVDPNGLNLQRSWMYDRNGNVLGTTDPAGATTRYVYDATDREVFAIDAMGNLRQQVYDAAGRVVRSTVFGAPIPLSGLPAAPTPAQVQALVTSLPAQDAVEHRVYDRDGRLAATVDGTGAVMRYSYDGNGNVVERVAYATRIALGSWNPGTVPAPVADTARDERVRTVYDALHRAIYTIDAAGGVVAQTYDGDGNVLQRIAYATPVAPATTATAATLSAAVAGVANAARDLHVRHTYDAAGRLTWSADGAGAVTQRVYDRSGNVVRHVAYATAVTAGAAASSVAVSALDRITSRAYDTANRMVFEIDALNAVTELSYDGNGNVLRRLAYAKALMGVPALGTAGTVAAIRTAVAARADAALDRTGRYWYDPAGRHTFTADALGAATEMLYDGAGRIVTTIRFAAMLPTSVLSLATTLQAAKSFVTADAANDRISRTAYDASGRLVYTVAPHGAVVSNQYDGAGRLKRTTRHYGAIPVSSVASTVSCIAQKLSEQTADVTAQNRAEAFEYNAAGQRVRSTDALGGVETYTLDALGRRTAFTNKKGATWTYHHDAAGRLTRETSPTLELTSSVVSNSQVVTTTATGQVVTWLAYDALGNLTQRTEAAGRAGEERTTTYHYDAAGRQVRVVHPPVGVYDRGADAVADNGESNVASRVEQQLALETITWYDALGNAVAGRDMGAAYSQKAYDRMGRVAYEIDALGFVTGYVRNAFGEVTELVRYGSGTALAGFPTTPVATKAQVDAVVNATGFDHSSDRKLVTTYDRAGRIIETREPPAYVSELDANDQRVAGFAARTTARSYDAFGQLVQERTLRNAANAWATTNHHYDLAGRETATVDPLNYLTTRQFDALGNVIEVKEYANALTVAWNPVTRPMPAASLEDRTTWFGFDKLDRKTSETRVGIEFSDSPDGSKTRSNTVTSWGYDALGNLISATDASGHVTRTYYDVLGRERAVAAPGRMVEGITTPLTPLKEFKRDAHGNVVATIEHARGVVATSTTYAFNIVDDPNNRISLAKYDLLGRAVQTRDAAGANVFYSYDPRGQVAKKWQGVTGNDGVTRTLFEVHQYDALGRLFETWTPASSAVLQGSSVVFLAQKQAGVWGTILEYNVFGEVVRKGNQGGRQEYFDYDHAGRVWRTNSGDGIDRIQLFDATGRVTAEIRSSGAGHDNRDLKGLISAEGADLQSGLRRVDMKLDALGRVVTRFEAFRGEDQGGVSVRRQQATATQISGPAVRLQWNSLAHLGSGDVKVTIEVWYPDGTMTAHNSGVRAAEEAVTGVTIQPAPVVGEVRRIVVYKKDVDGAWRVVMDQAPGNGYCEVDVLAPPGYTMLEMRPGGSAGDTGWQAVPLYRFTESLRYDARSLQPGTYEYRVRATSPGESSLRTIATGTVTLSQAHEISMSPDLNGGSRARRPKVEQKFDRWGNVVEVSDPRSAAWRTYFKYNANNQVVRQGLPDTNGLSSGDSPVSEVYYDRTGRQVAVRDQRGMVNGQVHDAGGNLVEERHADSGLVGHGYNLFGDKVKSTDAEQQRVTTFTYDAAGRLLAADRGGADTWTMNNGAALFTGWRNLVDRWSYDELGRKLTQTNAQGDQLRYTYDLRGNVIETRQPMGQATRAVFDMQGRKSAEVDANGSLATWQYDYFGALHKRTDLGGVTFDYAYDHARQLVAQSSGRGQSISYAYDAAGQTIRITDAVTNKVTTYLYDLSGRRVRERTVQAGTTYQDNHLAYDAQGHLRDVADGRVHIVMEYDKAGNRTRIINSVMYKGVSSEASHGADRHFRYDAMNRQVMVDAVDAAGNLGQQGHSITYDRNGNRTSDTYYGTRVRDATGGLQITYYDSSDRASYNKSLSQVNFTRDTGMRTETYRYDRLNRLSSIVRDGVQVDVRLYDGAGRVVQSGPYTPLTDQYVDLVMTGLEPEDALGRETRLSRYDANGRLSYQMTRRGDGRRLTDVSFDSATSAGGWAPDGYDAAGNSRGYVVENIEGGYVNEYRTTLQKFDGYRAGVTTGTSTQQQGGSVTQRYDVNGHLVEIDDSLQGENDRWFVNDAEGRALFVNQYGHVRRQLIVNGEVLGIYGVGVDPVDPVGRNQNPNFANLVDFNFTYSRVSTNYPNAGPGSYIVRTGESLQDIARAAYGDSALWYRIAEANGLDSTSDMRVGQTLSIPNLVGSAHNDSTTFKPYDPSRIEGDKTPHMPMPKGGDGCGGVGQLVMVVVAVVATVFTAGAMSGVAAGFAQTMAAGAGVLGGATGAGIGAAAATAVAGSTLGTVGTLAVAGAVGSIASQAVGLASGTIRSFSWKGVALGAMGGAVSGGMAGWAPVGGLSSSIPNVIVKAAISSAVTQGAAVAVGLQRSFDWRGVAASAVGAGVGQAVGGVLGSAWGGTPMGDFAARAVTGLAAGTAAAVMRGGKVAIQQVAVDAFGNALGSSLADAASSPGAAPAASTPFPDRDQLFIDGRSAVLPELAEMEALNRRLVAGYQPASMDPEDFDLVAAAGKVTLGKSPSVSEPQALHRASERQYRADLETIRAGYLERGVDPAQLGIAWQRLGLEDARVRAAYGVAPVPAVTMSGSITPSGIQRSDARSSANDYWNEVQDDGARQGSFLKYAFGGTMRTLSGVGHSAWEAAVGANGNPWDLAGGARKGVANFGPEMFNGVANALKTTLDGYSLIAEKLGIREGTFAGFRESDPYNITPLYKYENKTEAAAGLLTNFAMAGAAARYGGYAIEFDTASAGTTFFANPFGVKLVSPRYQPGVVTYGDDLASASGKWLDAGTPTPIPLQVAKQLQGRSFETFDELRGAVWQAVARDAELSKGFGLKNLQQMESGYAPIAPRAFQNEAFGLRFNLHHVRTIGSGGPVYDLSNIRIVSPKTHYGLHYK